MRRVLLAALLLAPLAFSAFGQTVDWSQGIVYEYDGSGNVKKIGTDTYVYDTAQRLIRATVAGSQQSYTYDAFGNRKTCLSSGGSDCQYGFAVSSSTNRVVGRRYDKRGNMEQLPEGNTLEYDELGRVRKETSTGRQVYYIYTADDERIAIYEADGQLATHSWRWTVRGLDKKPLREFTSDGPSGTTNFKWSKDHIWREGALLASRQLDTTAPTGVSTYHYHVDHLGTPRQVTTSSALIVGRHGYHPFGQELPSTATEPNEENLKFTGHERDMARDRLPLDYMHARYYDNGWGRFLSVDPTWASADLDKPQAWNRYSYVRNNPVRFMDPDGRCPDGCVVEIVLIAAAFAAVTGTEATLQAPSTVPGRTNAEVMASQVSSIPGLVRTAWATLALTEYPADMDMTGMGPLITDAQQLTELLQGNQSSGDAKGVPGADLPGQGKGWTS